MGRQLGWVWFGGREYKIVVFYLTNNNSVFCRENDDNPVLLVSQLPKRVELGFSGTIPILNTRTQNDVGPIGIAYGGYGIPSAIVNGQRIFVETTIGNSLDDKRFIVGNPSLATAQLGANAPTEFRFTIDIEVSAQASDGTGEGFVTLIMGDLFQPIARISASGVVDPGNDRNGINALNRGIVSQISKGYLNPSYIQSQAGNSLSDPPFSGSCTYNIVDISNAFGFMARILSDKTIFGITDGISRAEFPSYRSRITTGTLDTFATYELPVVPLLDSDLFRDGDGVLSDEKQPYSIVRNFRSRNYYSTENVFTEMLVRGSDISPFTPFTILPGPVSLNDFLATKDYLVNNSEPTVLVYDSAIHQSYQDAIPRQIPGLPANTKAVLGVLACPV
jgi:hypothetical protein